MPLAPQKANAPPIVYPDTILAGTLAFQGLETIRWRDAQIVEPLDGIEHSQLPTSN
jgi:hypothetical protein